MRDKITHEEGITTQVKQWSENIDVYDNITRTYYTDKDKKGFIFLNNDKYHLWDIQEKGKEKIYGIYNTIKEAQINYYHLIGIHISILDELLESNT